MDGIGEVTLRAGVVFPVPAPDLARLWMTAVHEAARLSGEEAEQVRYHRPQRVGDLIFNWFD